MKQLYTLSFFLIISTSLLFAQQVKVIGYLPYYRFGFQDQIAYEKLTHLNLAFLNADTLGNLSIGGQDITPVVQKAKAANPSIEIFISLAGGALTPEWRAAYDKFLQPAERSGFIHSLITYIETNQLDGIDVDLEWSDVDEKYSPFVLELKDSLVAHTLQMSAAWPATTRYADISDSALAAIDFINLMAYDLTGSWAPNNPGPHSPYSFAEQGITYWKNQGVTGDRMTLGVPFYGTDFTDQSNVHSFTYGSIVAEDSAYAWQDQVGQRYYNGIPTIRAKTQLAILETSGIMIWELGQDAYGDLSNFSLLSAIDETVQGFVQELPEDLPIDQAYFYPNPVQNQWNLFYDGFATLAQITLRDMQGRIVWEAEQVAGLDSYIGDIGFLPTGMYLVELQIDGQVRRQRVVKR